jgi:hypothetical protein
MLSDEQATCFNKGDESITYELVLVVVDGSVSVCRTPGALLALVGCGRI